MIMTVALVAGKLERITGYFEQGFFQVMNYLKQAVFLRIVDSLKLFFERTYEHNNFLLLLVGFVEQVLILRGS